MKNELCLSSFVFALVLLLGYIESGSALRVYHNNEYEVSDIDKRISIPHPGRLPRRRKQSLRRNRIILIDQGSYKPKQLIYRRQNVAIPKGPFRRPRYDNNVFKRRIASPRLKGHGEDNEVSVRNGVTAHDEDKYDKSFVLDGTNSAEYTQPIVLKRGKITPKPNDDNEENEPGFEDDIKSLAGLVGRAEKEIELRRPHTADLIDRHHGETEYEENKVLARKHEAVRTGDKRQEIIHALNEDNVKGVPDDDIESLGTRMDEAGNDIKEAKYEQTDKHAAAATRYIISKIQEIQDKLFKRTGNKELEDKLNLMAPEPKTKNKDKPIISLNARNTTSNASMLKPVKLIAENHTAVANKSKKNGNDDRNKPQTPDRRKVIPEEVVDKILEKFQQLKKEAKHMATGTSKSRHTAKHAVEHAEGTEWKKDVTSSIPYPASPSICCYTHKNAINKKMKRMVTKILRNVLNTNTTEFKMRKNTIGVSNRHVSQTSTKEKSKLTKAFSTRERQLIPKYSNDTTGKKRTISIIQDGRAMLNLKSDVAGYDLLPFANYNQQETTQDETFSSLQDGLKANPYAYFSMKAEVALPELPPTLDLNEGEMSNLQKIDNETPNHSSIKHDEPLGSDSYTNPNIPPDPYEFGSNALFDKQEKTLLGATPENVRKSALTMQSEGTEPLISSSHRIKFDRQGVQSNGQAQLFDTAVVYPGQKPIFFKQNKYTKGEQEMKIKQKSFSFGNSSSRKRHTRAHEYARSSDNIIISPTPSESINKRFGISLPELLDLETDPQLFSHDIHPAAKANSGPWRTKSYLLQYRDELKDSSQIVNALNNQQRKRTPSELPEYPGETNELQEADDPLKEIENSPNYRTVYQPPLSRSTIRHNNYASSKVKNDKIQQRSEVIAAHVIANALQTELGINHPFIQVTSDPFEYVEKRLHGSRGRQRKKGI